MLLVHAGLALVRFRALPVMGVDGTISPAPGVKIQGGGAVSIPQGMLDSVLTAAAAGIGNKQVRSDARSPWPGARHERRESTE